VRFIARAAEPLEVVPFALHLSGAGTVWFDDFLIRPLPAGAPPSGPRGTVVERGVTPGSLVGQRPRPDMSLLYDESSDAGDRTGTVLDRSGHAHHGALIGARWVAEGEGRVFEMGGGGAHLLVRGHPLADLGQRVSLSLWIKPAAQREPITEVVGGGERDLYHAWSLLLSDAGDGSYRVSATLLSRRFFAGVTVPPERWSHLVLSHDGETARLYVNGALAGGLPAPGTWLGQGSHGFVRFGAGLFEKAMVRSFIGRMAGIRVFSRPLSTSDVQAVYAAGPLGRVLP
jgi:hypothetical protein